MTVEELFNRIESVPFSVAAGLASGEGAMIATVESHPDFLALSDAVATDPLLSLRIIRRVNSLAQITIDPRFENPYDISLAAYALLLWKKAPQRVGAAPARPIVSTAVPS